MKPCVKCIFVLVALVAPSFATTRYIAQNAGTFSGGSACNGQAAITPATWNSVSEAPGDISYICGTITASAGATILTVSWSGSSGNPIQLIWDTGAVLTAPYWNTGGGININANYVTLNGGTNGLMTATANGDNFSNQQQSTGIAVSGSNVEIKNLTGTNLYQRNASNGSGGNNTFWIFFNPGSDHIKVDGCNLSNARSLVFVQYTTVTDAQIFNNTLDYSSWMVIIGADNNGSTASGVLVYGNTLGPHFDIWLDTAQTMHADGIYLFASLSGASITGQVYNNYITGDMCSNTSVNCTAYIYLGGTNNTYVYNNVIVHLNTSGNGPEGEITVRGLSPGPAPSNNYILNNTLTSATGSVAIKNGGGSVGTGLVIENNVIANQYYGLEFGPSSLSSLSKSNYNDYYNNTYIAVDNADSGPANNFTTLANWQSQGFDANGTGGNPLLSVSYVLQSGSSAMGVGTNLTSLGITALDSDKSGAPRPASGAWDAGAYQLSGGVNTTGGGTVLPGTSLTAVAH
jgi:hypothetical protein